MNKKLFTSEAVGAGHPDKICDQISDHILDAVLSKDKNARVAIETMASNHLIIIAGELTTTGYVDVVKKAWEMLFTLGYTENDFTIISNVNSQSPDIALGVDKENGELGAGDQGIMFGYATNETRKFMPLAHAIAISLVKAAEKIRTSEDTWIKSDMKSQVTIDYSGTEPKIDTILMSIQHAKNQDYEKMRQFVIDRIVNPTVEKYGLNLDYKFFFNPTGVFEIGGPFGDTGLTGRKIIVDTYGGYAHHGGGAFSGKDYTKVDRSAAYMCRYIAKNIVAANLADEIEIQISYGIGISKPISVSIVKSKNAKYSEDELIKMINNVFDLTPKGIIETLNLKNIKYAKTACFGHFGRNNHNFTWEKTDKIKDILAYFKSEKA
ncbi:S-adenosylmethionine synthase [Mycoplasmopsis californica]|uniref:Methionine adenosyltransferase n=1 Tax=Mycoplasmopsis equigenitalium TaxID=114883 RepID=A0ABY5J4A7_9BACT|nr:methionine adenosyltransferase [Mycoplasmopsis equigenitalium]UUD36967.1 methionine adenosyltransferase [Mycoplasmopsis equigenitalium]VEU69738.1 S-adenosylmethionine synthase [Mycoplasmopsis californica]